MERGGSYSRPRTPDDTEYTQLTDTTLTTLVAAVSDKECVLYHLAISNAGDEMVTITIKFGSKTIFVFNLPADGGGYLLNFLGCEIAGGLNTVLTAQLGSSKVVDVSTSYILK